MPQFHLESLDRQAYIDSVDTIADARSVRFATMSLEWWDRHFNWRLQGCTVLCDEEKNHLCYVFYKIDRYNEYLTIHNIFTPAVERRKGYAQALLSMIMALAAAGKVRRFRLTSISNSLDFYLALGFIYWGVNSVGDYYCNLPLPKEGLEGIEAMVSGSETSELLKHAYSTIHKKTDANEAGLSEKQTKIYQSDLLKMGKSYRHTAFRDARQLCTTSA